MRRLLAILALLVTFGFPLSAYAMKKPAGFAGKVWDSTVALYGAPQGKKPHFLCTAQVIGKIDGGYRLLSAGHCVLDENLPTGLQFLVAQDLGGPLTPVTVVKAALDGEIDLAIFDWKTSKKLPVLQLGDESGLRVGDDILNVNFALGAVKQFSRGPLASMPAPTTEDCPVGDCAGTLLVHTFGGPGASGSAVLSAKTHKIIGVVVWEFDEGIMGFGVEPISLYQKFLKLQAPPAPKKVSISDDVFSQRFGEAHQFNLVVTGPSPTFINGGYVWHVETNGFELSEEYYYSVPVFIDRDEDGYYLTSTKDGYAVGLTLVKESPADPKLK